MRLVIDIDDKTYADIKKGIIYSSIRDVPQESVVAIANGIPLPKGHGRLIDADEILKDTECIEDNLCDEKDKQSVRYLRIEMESAPTIIEADTSGKEQDV